MIIVDFIDKTGEILITTLVPIAPKKGQTIYQSNNIFTIENITYQVGGTFKIKALITPYVTENMVLPNVVAVSDPPPEEKFSKTWISTLSILLIIWLTLMTLVLVKHCQSHNSLPQSDFNSDNIEDVC